MTSSSARTSLRERLRRRGLKNEVVALVWEIAKQKGIRRSMLRATVNRWTAPAARVALDALLGDDDRAQRVALEAVMRGLPEACLWAIPVVTRLPEGRWKQADDSYWRHSTEALRGALRDPFLAPRLAASKGPDADLARRLGAVLAVVAECERQARRGSAVWPSRFLNHETVDDPFSSAQWAGKPMTSDLPRLANPDLTALIWDRPGLADRITELMFERGTDDADVIREILDSGTPVLAEGTL